MEKDHVLRTFFTSEKKARLIHGAPHGTKHRQRIHKEAKIRIQVPQSKETIEGPISQQTKSGSVKGPRGGDDPVVFVTYTPQERPKDTSIVSYYPPDPSGDDSEPGVILQTGNDYIRYSNDNVLTFEMLANTDVIDGSFAGGEHGDQVMLFVPAIRCFVWYLQYYADPTSKDGAFRIAFAKLSDLAGKVKDVWSVYDFHSSDFGLPGIDFDYPDIAATDSFLYASTGAVGKGRIFVRFPLKDFAAGSVKGEYTPPLSIDSKNVDTDSLRYAHFCQGAGDRGIWAGHVDNSKLRIYEWPDSGSLSTHDVSTVTWPNPNPTDYSSVCKNAVDWLKEGGDAEVSALVRRSDELWLAWAASRGAATPTSFKYPQPHVRVATVRMSDWTETAEMQVWNPDYAFAYPDLNVNHRGDVAIAVAFGGPNNFADAAFGILGDYVVWYQNASDTALPRWGDYVTVRPCRRNANWFAGFGYYTLNDASIGAYQEPYCVMFARKSDTP
ncbi:hypothetical protein [Paraburkholderia caribensis]|uniref:hypothetical protein n=1 Tax=Paraburkholderia caribensis TaxID=75105 RepID=UPI0034D1A595